MKTNSAIGCVCVLHALLLGAHSVCAQVPAAAPATTAPVAASTTATASESARQKSFDAFTDELAAEWMRANPAAATAQQYFTGAEQDAVDRQLLPMDSQYGTPLEAAPLRAYVARAQRALQRLKTYSRAELLPVQRISAASLEWQLNDAIRMAQMSDQRFVFDQFRGLQVGVVNFLSQVHPMRTRRDVENYLARLALVAPVLDVGVTVAKERERKGTIPPKFILTATIDGIGRFTEGILPLLEQRGLRRPFAPSARH